MPLCEECCPLVCHILQWVEDLKCIVVQGESTIGRRYVEEGEGDCIPELPHCHLVVHTTPDAHRQALLQADLRPVPEVLPSEDPRSSLVLEEEHRVLPLDQILEGRVALHRAGADALSRCPSNLHSGSGIRDRPLA